MFNIEQALFVPTVFIRYNPDEYRGEQFPTEARLSTLLHCIKDAIRNKKESCLIQLYYDGYGKRMKLD